MKKATSDRHELVFFEPRLTPDTVRLAEGFQAVCAFVNDQLSEPVLEKLHEGGTRLICLRCAGFNQVDLVAANRLKMPVTRVAAYSPHAVAEHTLGLCLALNRRLHKAYNRVRENNFALDGLLGFDLYGRTVGIIGTGAIGECVAKIFHGMGCKVLMFDVRKNPNCESLGDYTELDNLFASSDIVTLHCPLTPQTHHLINHQAIEKMKPGVMLINTSRGALVDTLAVITGLKSKHIGHLALDVYEEESDLFFEDLSEQVITDDTFSRLLTFPNVLITAHQAFFTEQALSEIARVTAVSLDEFAAGKPLSHSI